MSFEFFGLTLTELIVYGCIAFSIGIVIYIIRLVKGKSKEEAQTEMVQAETQQTVTLEAISFAREIWRHYTGLNPGVNPEQHKKPSRKRKKPTQSPNTVESDEETYTPTKEDQELLKRLNKRFGGE